MHLRTFLIPLALLPSPAFAVEEAWRLDTVHTQIHFSVDHLGFSEAMGLLKVRAGTLRFDPADLSKCTLDVTIDPATLLMGDTKWQDTVTSWQFLNVKRWPDARYVAEHCEQTSATAGVVHGSLSLHGKSAPIDLTFHVNKVGNDPYTFKHTAGFSAQAQLKRSAFGMDKLLSVVGDLVALRIEVEAVRDRGAAADAPPADAPAPPPPETGDDGATQ